MSARRREPVWLSHPRLLGLVAGAGAVLVLTTTPATTAGPGGTCRSVLSASLDTRDAKALQDLPTGTVRLRAGTARSVRVTVSRGSRRIASGTVAGTVRSGTMPVVLELARTPRVGRLAVRVTGVVRRCGTVRHETTSVLRSASLPVRAVLRGSTAAGGRTVVGVLLRPVAGRRSTAVRVRLKDATGSTVATAAVSAPVQGPTELTLRAKRILPAGRYRLAVSGQASGSTTSAVSAVALSATSDPTVATVAPARQRAVVDWSGGVLDREGHHRVRAPGHRSWRDGLQPAGVAVGGVPARVIGSGPRFAHRGRHPDGGKASG